MQRDKSETVRCAGVVLNWGASALPTHCQAVTSRALPEKGWRIEKFGAYCPHHAGLSRRGRAA